MRDWWKNDVGVRLAMGLLGSLIGLVTVSENAFSQSTELINSGALQANPGLVTPRLDNGVIRNKQPDRIPRIVEPPTEVETPKQETPSASDADQATVIHVNQITVEGSTLFNANRLERMLAPYENRQTTLGELNQLTAELYRKYSDAGYPTTQVYLPPQALDTGNIKIQVVEGRLGTISVTGNKYFRKIAIERHLMQKSDSLLNVRVLQENLNQINQQQPFHLRAVLQPGEEVGKTDLKLEVSEQQPWQISPTWDNQGRPFIGSMRYGVEVQNKSLLGFGDRLSTRWMGSSGTQIATASYSVPLNRRGTELSYSYSFGHVNVDLPTTNPPKILGIANNHSLLFSHPFNQTRSFTGDIALNARRSTTHINGDNAIQDDVRSMSLGVSYNRSDRWGRSFLRLQTDVGVKLLGGNYSFWKSNIYANRVVLLPKGNFLILRASSQFAPGALPPVESFQIGGAYTVRGFTEGLLVGDRGYNLGVEWRWPVPGLRRVSPWLSRRVQGVFFYDMGQVWVDHDNRNFISDHSDRTLLTSVGFGVRGQLTQYLTGFADFGFGLSPQQNIEPNAKPTVRLHFGVRSDLLPTDYKSRK